MFFTLHWQAKTNVLKHVFIICRQTHTRVQRVYCRVPTAAFAIFSLVSKDFEVSPIRKIFKMSWRNDQIRATVFLGKNTAIEFRFKQNWSEKMEFLSLNDHQFELTLLHSTIRQIKVQYCVIVSVFTQNAQQVVLTPPHSTGWNAAEEMRSMWILPRK